MNTEKKREKKNKRCCMLYGMILFHKWAIRKNEYCVYNNEKIISKMDKYEFCDGIIKRWT